jgi:sugar lactone lactonase YvrE
MRQLIFITAIVIALTTVGCGGGGGGGPQHAPNISNLQYSPHTAIQGQGGGSINVTGTFDFVDAGGDISTFTITIYDSHEGFIASHTTPITGGSGISSGTLGAAVTINTTVIGNYSFKIYITDSTGSQSNTLTATFGVTSNVPTLTDTTNYKIELLATGIGAVNGMKINSSGVLYFTDNPGGNNGRLLRILSPSQPGVHSYEVVAAGIFYPQDVAFTQDGRMFLASSTGPNSSIFEVMSNGSMTVDSTGYSFPESMEAFGNTLFVSTGGDGTVSKIDSSGNGSVFLSGFGIPYGPTALSIDSTGKIYFIVHGTGQIFTSDQSGTTAYLNSITAFGSTFTAVSPSGDLFVSDCVLGSVYKIDTSGNKTLFASGFVGKSSPPVIGPTGIAFDSNGNMYIGDGSDIWKVTAK